MNKIKTEFPAKGRRLFESEKVAINAYESARNSYGQTEPKEFLVGFIPHKSGTYRIEIDDAIESISQFSTAIQVLENATENDEVVIYLQTPGGSINAGEAFIHALRKCAAPIHVVATGGVHSMGTRILLEADSIELSTGFHALIHIGSQGAYGNSNEYFIQADFDAKFWKQQFRDAYEGFLSPQEMEDMIGGKDMWLDGQGWLERATKRGEYFKAKYETFQAEQEAAEQASVAKKPRKRKPLAIGNKELDTTEEVS